MKKFIKQFFNAVIGGMMIGIGGCVSLSCENKIVGAVLFSLGLFAIIQFGFGLYTGKIGYVPLRKPSYLFECLSTLLGNIAGTFIDAFLLRNTRIFATIGEKANTSVLTKVNDNLLSAFILAVFCGMLMFLAVENARKCREENAHIEKVTGIILCVVVFIISGFNHCIADMFYIFLSGQFVSSIGYLLIVILGNSVGGMLIPLLKMLTETPFERER